MRIIKPGKAIRVVDAKDFIGLTLEEVILKVSKDNNGFIFPVDKASDGDKYESLRGDLLLLDVINSNNNNKHYWLDDSPVVFKVDGVNQKPSTVLFVENKDADDNAVLFVGRGMLLLPR